MRKDIQFKALRFSWRALTICSLQGVLGFTGQLLGGAWQVASQVVMVAIVGVVFVEWMTFHNEFVAGLDEDERVFEAERQWHRDQEIARLQLETDGPGLAPEIARKEEP